MLTFLRLLMENPNYTLRCFPRWSTASRAHWSADWPYKITQLSAKYFLLLVLVAVYESAPLSLNIYEADTCKTALPWALARSMDWGNVYSKLELLALPCGTASKALRLQHKGHARFSFRHILYGSWECSNRLASNALMSLNGELPWQHWNKHASLKPRDS